MLKGESVTLELQDGTISTVNNVLVSQSDISDQSVLDVQTRFINQARYKGDQDTLTLEWPKTETSVLIGAHVTVRGRRGRVYGNPMPYNNAICPTDWNRQVTVVCSLFLYKVTFLKNDPIQDEWGVWNDRYSGTDIMCNLLRKTDDMGEGAGTSGAQDILMFEMPIEYWDKEYVAFQYPATDDGEFVRITGVNYGTDTVVINGEGGVADGNS